MSKELNSKEKNEEKITEKLDLKEKTDNKNFQPFSYIEKNIFLQFYFQLTKTLKEIFKIDLSFKH